MVLVKQLLLVNLLVSLKKQGKKVVLGAADTFRAAAIDQLTSLGRSNRCSYRKAKSMGI